MPADCSLRRLCTHTVCAGLKCRISAATQTDVTVSVETHTGCCAHRPPLPCCQRQVRRLQTTLQTIMTIPFRQPGALRAVFHMVVWPAVCNSCVVLSTDVRVVVQTVVRPAVRCTFNSCAVLFQQLCSDLVPEPRHQPPRRGDFQQKSHAPKQWWPAAGVTPGLRPHTGRAHKREYSCKYLF